MKIRNSNGFTLIELIMVIVILGILSTVLVPRYFNFAEDAHKATVDSFIGNVKSSLFMYASDQILTSGVRAYPDGDDFENTAGLQFGIVFDEIPNNWNIVASGNNMVIFEYSKTDPLTQIRYTCDGTDVYTLELIQGPPYILNPDG
ncbi:MAG: prepilin-type N-terminal cleavage/methylation domain-containing protein [Candidatus Marinimicrobia bacterium]|nr:prepilin-type N-terminal cleavage/methylation domain-containing protein [Candidatus Neomarinimicrobiota bacterium]